MPKVTNCFAASAQTDALAFLRGTTCPWRREPKVKVSSGPGDAGERPVQTAERSRA